MPSSITLKNVPDEIHMRLREAAQAHRRSVNSEAIVCLEQVLLPRKASVDEELRSVAQQSHDDVTLRPRRESVEEELRRIRAFRATIPAIDTTNEEMNDMKNFGRK